MSAARQVAETLAGLNAELNGIDEHIAAREAELAFHRGAPLPPEDFINFLDEYVDSAGGKGREAIGGILGQIVYPGRSGVHVQRHERTPLTFGEMEKVLEGDRSGAGLGSSGDDFPLPLPATYVPGAFATQTLILIFGAQIKAALRQYLEAHPIRYRNVRPAEIGLPLAQRRQRVAELEGELARLRSSKEALARRIVQLGGVVGMAPAVALPGQPRLLALGRR
jgi:hypothetical protein